MISGFLGRSSESSSFLLDIILLDTTWYCGASFFHYCKLGTTNLQNLGSYCVSEEGCLGWAGAERGVGRREVAQVRVGRELGLEQAATAWQPRVWKSVSSHAAVAAGLQC